MAKRGNEIRVGLTVLAALLFLYLGVAWARRSGWFAPDDRRYFVMFEQVNGLKTGDPVNIRGYTVGRVEAILPGQEAIRVEISVDRNFSLYQDARADIQIRELMGGKQIELLPGTRAPQLETGTTFAGRTSLDVSSGLSAVSDLMGELDMSRANQLLARFDTLSLLLLTLAREADLEALRRSMASLERTAADFQALSGELRRSDLPQRLDSLLDETRSLMRQGGDLLDAADPALLARLDTLLSEAGSTLAAAGRLLGKAETIAARIEDPEGPAARFLNDPALLQRLDSTLLNVNLALEALHSGRIIVGLRRKEGE